MAEPSLQELLSRALPAGPLALRAAQGGGDALALALHCLMVRDGYVALDRDGRRLPGYKLPADWNGVDFLWAWDYERRGAARHFRLQCAVQPQTRRVFIHASELLPGGAPVPDNIQVMGLQLGNYVQPDQGASTSGAGISSSSSWEGVIVSEAALVAQFDEFLAAPLWRTAEKLPPGSADAGETAAGGWWEQAKEAAYEQRHILLPAAGVAVAAAAAAAFLHWRQGRAST